MKPASSPQQSRESGQVLVVFALLTFVIIGLMGLATDIGRVYLARAELGRAVDAAALAGAKELPSTANADAKARAFIAANDPDNTMTVTVNANTSQQQVEVIAHKSVKTIFLRALGVGTVHIANNATAGFGVTPVDAVMAIDATGSMGDVPCNGSQNNSGCPIWEAKNAATSFTNTLLPSSNTQIGVTSFRGCFNPPNPYSVCVQTSTIGSSNSASAMDTKISQISALGGSGTNVCGGLDKAYSVLTGAGSNPASNTARIIVILTDGDNTMNPNSRTATSPVAACKPPGDMANLASGCSSATETNEADLDTKTKTRADAIKAAKAEIYIVGFGVCGTNTASQMCDTSWIGIPGASYPDSKADRNLLKCVASSASGTNDHYFEANTASELPAIFTKIAQAIAFRLVK